MRLCLVRVERQLVPSRRLAALFIPSTPIAIKAGGNIGNMGFYPLPEESGKQSRYHQSKLREQPKDLTHSAFCNIKPDERAFIQT